MATTAELPVKPATETTIVPPKGADGKFVSVRESMGIRTKKPAAEKPAEKPVEKPGDAKPGDEPVKPAAEKPKKKVAPAPAPAPVIDEEKLGRAVGEAVARATKPVEAPAKDESESLPPKMRQKFQVLAHMAKANPELADLPKQFVASVKKLEEYTADWKSKNKGKAFNLEDEDHAEFLAGNDVTWDEDLYVESLATLKSAGLISEVEKKFEARLAERESRERAQAAIPQVIAHRKTIAKVLFNQLGDEFKNVLDGNGTYQPAEMAKLIEANEFYEDLLPIAQHTEEVAGEIYRIAYNLTKLDVVNNDTHREIVKFLTDTERKLKAKPADEQRNADGHLFASSDDWEKLSESERKTRWTLNEQYVSTLFAFEQAKLAKQIIEKSNKRLEKIIEKRGLKPSENGKPASAAPAEKPAEAAAKPPEERTPSGVVAPRVAAPANRPETEKTAIRNKILGR